MELRLSGGFEPTPGAYRALVSEAGPAVDAARPYTFFLAHPFDGDPDAERETWASHPLGDVPDGHYDVPLGVEKEAPIP